MFNYILLVSFCSTILEPIQAFQNAILCVCMRAHICILFLCWYMQPLSALFSQRGEIWHSSQKTTETHVLSSFPWLSMISLMLISQLQDNLPIFSYTDIFLVSPDRCFSWFWNCIFNGFHCARVWVTFFPLHLFSLFLLCWLSAFFLFYFSFP